MGGNVGLEELDTGGYATTTLYSADYDAYFGYADVNEIMDFYLFENDGTLWVSDTNPGADVPAPAAVWLMCSSLLAMTGFRRKKRL